MNRSIHFRVAVVIGFCVPVIFAGAVRGQRKASEEEKQEVSEKVFAEARRYLLEKNLATEERIERAVKTQGKAAVVRFARGKGFGGAAERKRDAKRQSERKQETGREPHPSVGLTPLSDPGDWKYKGHPGGLYPGGTNTPPEGHLLAALKEAAKIRPLDAEGRPAAGGKIVLISNGMSNTTQEFSAFVRMAERDATKSASVVIVDCAQGGMEASMWADPEKVKRRNRPSPWDVQAQRLKAAGVSPEQVQVVWIKQARARPEALGEFPRHAETLKEDLVVVLNKLKERFPNLRLAYLSSRIYAGYARSNLNPEPYAYESAFSVRWLIEDQINGKKVLNYDPSTGEVKAPLVLWGPYLWADGLKGRQDFGCFITLPDGRCYLSVGGLVWKREDLAGDGTHPSDSGRRKVAEQLLEFFKNDPTARVWFLNPAASSGD